MSRTRPLAHTLSVPLDALELDAFDQMMRATGSTSDANTLRAALWHFARHLGLDLPLDTFALRTHGGNRRTRTKPPRVPQELFLRPSTLKRRQLQRAPE